MDTYKIKAEEWDSGDLFVWYYEAENAEEAKYMWADDMLINETDYLFYSIEVI
jgi:hypothetical protein